MQRKHLARDRRLHPPDHRRPAGHRHQRDRVQHHPLLEGNAPAVPFPLRHPAAQRR